MGKRKDYKNSEITLLNLIYQDYLNNPEGFSLIMTFEKSLGMRFDDIEILAKGLRRWGVIEVPGTYLEEIRITTAGIEYIKRQ